MTITTRGNTRVISEPFAKSVLLIRRLLVSAGLSDVEEFDVSTFQPPQFLGQGSLDSKLNLCPHHLLVHFLDR